MMMMMAEHRERVDGGEGHTVMFTVLTAAASPTHTLLHENDFRKQKFSGAKEFLIGISILSGVVGGGVNTPIKPLLLIRRRHKYGSIKNA